MNAINSCLGIVKEITAVLLTALTFPTAIFNRNPSFLPSNTEIVTVISHGYLHNRSADIYLRYRLNQHPEIIGPVFTVNLGHPFQSIEDYTRTFHQLILEIKKMLPKDKILKINLIGHSMGGLICTNYAATYAQEDNVHINKIVTIASPLNGSTASYLTNYFCKCADEMTPNSSFLQNLKKKAATLDQKIFFHIGCGMDCLVSKKDTFYNEKNDCEFPYQGHITPLYSPAVADCIINSLTKAKLAP